jgi:secreted trypsin-like serine protease
MFKIVIVILSLGFVACSQNLPSEEVLSADKHNMRVFGGDDVKADSSLARSVVAVVTSGSGLCSGVLLQSKFVLTAAHCVNSEKISNLKVVFGTNVSKSATIRYPDQILIHPDFQPSRRQDWNDLALLRLAEPAPEGSLPVALNAAPVEIEPNTEVKSLGYGIDKVRPGLADNQRGAGHLRQVKLKVKDPAFSKNEFTLNQGLIDGGACQGDSGGPVFLIGEGGPRLIGIVSRVRGLLGFSCTIDSIVTRVDIYTSWIQQNL